MELKQSLEGTDVGDIRTKMEALQQASQKLAEAVYAQATAAQAGSATGGNGASGSDSLDGPAHEVSNAVPYLFDDDALDRAVRGIERLARIAR